MQVGSDDDGYSVRMKYKHFARYLRDAAHAPADDSPLYIFDGAFADRDGSKAMRADYKVERRCCVPPACWFDLFHLAPADCKEMTARGCLQTMRHYRCIASAPQRLLMQNALICACARTGEDIAQSCSSWLVRS